MFKPKSLKFNCLLFIFNEINVNLDSVIQVDLFYSYRRRRSNLQAGLQVLVRCGVLQHDPLITSGFLLCADTFHDNKASVTAAGDGFVTFKRNQEEHFYFWKYFNTLRRITEVFHCTKKCQDQIKFIVWLGVCITKTGHTVNKQLPFSV